MNRRNCDTWPIATAAERNRLGLSGSARVAKIEIAIVDDDESVRKGLSSLMRSRGFSVSVFASGESFLRSNSLRHTACLIADVQMPGMTGLELYQRLATSGMPIPTILITAYADEKVRTQALNDGVVCYLPKPIDASTLLASVHSALGEQKTHKTEL